MSGVLTTVTGRAADSDEASVAAAIEAVEKTLRKSKTSPPIDSLSWEPFTDPNGFGAVSIMIILKDKPSGELYLGDELHPVRDLFWDEFYRRSLERWPFVQFQLRSEQDEEEDDDEGDLDNSC